MSIQVQLLSKIRYSTAMLNATVCKCIILFTHLIQIRGITWVCVCVWVCESVHVWEVCVWVSVCVWVGRCDGVSVCVCVHAVGLQK